jgi:hypothetical protein
MAEPAPVTLNDPVIITDANGRPVAFRFVIPGSDASRIAIELSNDLIQWTSPGAASPQVVNGQVVFEDRDIQNSRKYYPIKQ